MPGEYVILYWEEDPRVFGATLLAIGWIVLISGVLGYVGVVFGTWYGCYERLRRYVCVFTYVTFHVCVFVCPCVIRLVPEACYRPTV